MDNGKVIIISPDGNLYFSSIGEKGHAVKLISYYDDNNIDYDKESAMFTPSQEFAFNLSDMGYIVFLVEDALTCLFLSQSGMFSYNQVNTLLENKDIFNEILNNNVISFNTELNSTFNVEANDIIAMANIGYVVINTIDNNYLMFCYENLSEKQLLYIKTIFDDNDKIDANLAFFGDLGFSNMGKVQSYEEFILAFNNLKNKKEGVKYVR